MLLADYSPINKISPIAAEEFLCTHKEFSHYNVALNFHIIAYAAKKLCDKWLLDGLIKPYYIAQCPYCEWDVEFYSLSEPINCKTCGEIFNTKTFRTFYIREKDYTTV